MFCLTIDICPKFYGYNPHPRTWPWGQGHGLRIFLLKFPFLGPHYFQTLDLVHIWCKDGYWSKILRGAIPTPVYMTFRSRSHTYNFMLKFYVKDFKTSLFPNPVMYFIHVWYDDRYWSKILQGTIPLSHTWTLRSRSWTENFMWNLYVKKYFRKEKRNSGELSCPATGLIMQITATLFCIPVVYSY